MILKFKNSILCLLVLSSITFASSPLELDPKLAKVVDQCKSSDSSHHVWVFKQWHAGAAVNTRADQSFSQNIPQRQNQTAIYQQLEVWIAAKKLKVIFAEGCSGEIDEQFGQKFNGWSLEDLRKASKDKNFSQIVSHVPLKLEAKFGTALNTLCADEPALIKANDLAFSDARGALGFLTRLHQYKDDPKRAKTYLDGVIELYKLSPSTSIDQAMQRLKADLKSSISRAKSYIEERNKIAVRAIEASSDKEAAIVFGGLHFYGLKEQLEKAHINCSIAEPTGYSSSDAQLLKDLDDALSSM